MEEQVLVTRNAVKKNPNLKKIQKDVYKMNKRVRGSVVKAKISKIVALKSNDSYLDLVGDMDEAQNQKIIQMPQNLNDFLECLERNHVCGLSGGGFPTVEKINTILTSKAPSRSLVINAVACDPGLLHDDWLLHNKLEQIEKGIEILARFITFDHIILATKLDISKYNEKMKYTIKRVPDRYPMGAEKILFQQVLGRTIPKDKIPAEQGILGLNVQTIYAIYQAVYHDQDLKTRFVTVADLNSGEAVIVRAAIGTKIDQITSKVWNGFRKKENDYLAQCQTYAGGGIMSATETSAEDAVTINTNMIAIGNAMALNDQAKCKGCGACKKNCPMGIDVAKAVKAINKGDYEKAKHYGAEQCIQCGACTYFCSAGKNTMNIIKKCSTRCS